jgi:hypothetical protein
VVQKVVVIMGSESVSVFDKKTAKLRWGLGKNRDQKAIMGDVFAVVPSHP